MSQDRWADRAADVQARYLEEHQDAGCIGNCGLCGDIILMPDACESCTDRAYPLALSHDYHGWICEGHGPEEVNAAALTTCAICGCMIGQDSATRMYRGKLMHWRCSCVAGAPAVTEVPDVKNPSPSS